MATRPLVYQRLKYLAKAKYFHNFALAAEVFGWIFNLKFCNINVLRNLTLVAFRLFGHSCRKFSHFCCQKEWPQDHWLTRPIGWPLNLTGLLLLDFAYYVGPKCVLFGHRIRKWSETETGSLRKAYNFFSNFYVSCSLCMGEHKILPIFFSSQNQLTSLKIIFDKIWRKDFVFDSFCFTTLHFEALYNTYLSKNVPNVWWIPSQTTFNEGGGR